ncbi:MAG: hypothetical protein ACLQF0_17050 [Dissulfurispiraceae bacterium]
MSEQFWTDLVEDLKAGRKSLKEFEGKTRQSLECLLQQQVVAGEAAAKALAAGAE